MNQVKNTQEHNQHATTEIELMTKDNNEKEIHLDMENPDIELDDSSPTDPKKNLMFEQKKISPLTHMAFKWKI